MNKVDWKTVTETELLHASIHAILNGRTSKQVNSYILDNMPKDLPEKQEDTIYEVCSCLEGWCSKDCSLSDFDKEVRPTITERGKRLLEWFKYEL